MSVDMIIKQTILNSEGESLAIIQMNEGGYALAWLPEEELLAAIHDTLEEAERWLEEGLSLYRAASRPISSITSAKVLTND